MIFLLEMRLSSQSIESLKRMLNLYSVGVSSEGNLGGLALVRNKKVRLSLVSLSKYHIDSMAKLSKHGTQLGISSALCTTVIIVSGS